MKLNLRKASALQIAINDQIASTEAPVVVSIDRYSDPIETVVKATEKFDQGISKKRELLAVLYSIRSKTASASEQSGVSRLLAHNAHIDKVISLVKPLTEVRKFIKSDEHLMEAVADLRKETTQQPQYGYDKRDNFEASFISEEDVAKWKKEIAELKRKKQANSDALLEANVTNEIEISVYEEELLMKHGIL